MLLRTVDGKRLAVKGVVTLNLFWKNHPIKCQAVICPSVKQDLVLGFDFWTSVGLVVDTHNLLFEFTSNQNRVQVPMELTTLAHIRHEVAGLEKSPRNEFCNDEATTVPVWEFNHPDLTEDQKLQLGELLTRAFIEAPKGLGCTDSYITHLELTDKTPFKCKQFPLSHNALTVINQNVDELLGYGVI